MLWENPTITVVRNGMHGTVMILVFRLENSWAATAIRGTTVRMVRGLHGMAW